MDLNFRIPQSLRASGGFMRDQGLACSCWAEAFAKTHCAVYTDGMETPFALHRQSPNPKAGTFKLKGGAIILMLQFLTVVPV